MLLASYLSCSKSLFAFYPHMWAFVDIDESSWHLCDIAHIIAHWKCHVTEYFTLWGLFLHNIVFWKKKKNVHPDEIISIQMSADQIWLKIYD